MAKVDLHVHTRYSDHPSEWFLQRLGASESYTEPSDVLAAAESRGMDFVAITDHNTIDGALELARRHPDKVIVGVEATTYFPADGCKVHLLLYGIDERQFADIQELRHNIYRLREYVREKDIAHSVAHATYSINDRLTVEHLEQLIVLFDVFEVVNGSRDESSNRTWEAVLRSLTPAAFADLAERHNIEPMGSGSWSKGFTGGSDDHAGLLVGRTYTEAVAGTPVEFVNEVRRKAAVACGRHNDFRTLAFAIYKIAWEFSRAKERSMLGPLVEELNEALFGHAGSRSFGERIVASQKRAFSRFRSDPLTTTYVGLLDSLRELRAAPVERRLDAVFEAILDISDELQRRLVRTVRDDVAAGDMPAVVHGVSAALPALFLSAPFYSAMQHLSRSRGLLSELKTAFGLADGDTGDRVVWFTDTIDDLNGVSVTLQQIARHAERRGDDVHVVATPVPGSGAHLPSRVVRLPSLGGFSLPYYPGYELQVPSVMRSLQAIHDLAPDRIYVSTPGPVGLLGLLAAKVLGVECVAVYHTDFTLQAQRITEDGSASSMLEAYTRWFYAQVDEVHVPTLAYMDVLAKRGFDRCGMRLFRRGVDTGTFAPQPGARERLVARFGLAGGPIWLFTGRLARDKNISFLLEAFRAFSASEPDAALLIAGDGPHAEEFREAAAEIGHVVFTGGVPHAEMPELNAGADLLVFPSVTDTFGMSVLEAQSCGLPAIVSDVGGPQEIVRDGLTGRVLAATSPPEWALVAQQLLDDDVRHARMRNEARQHVLASYQWDVVLDDLCGRSSRHQPVPASPCVA